MLRNKCRAATNVLHLTTAYDIDIDICVNNNPPYSYLLSLCKITLNTLQHY